MTYRSVASVFPTPWKLGTCVPSSEMPHGMRITPSQDVSEASLRHRPSRSQGRLSPSKTLKAFMQGVFEPLVASFRSPQAFITTLATMGVFSGIMIASGGTLAPVLWSASLLWGVFQSIRAIQQYATAKESYTQEKALRTLGNATSQCLVTFIGTKPALKAGGLHPELLSNETLFQAITVNMQMACKRFSKRVLKKSSYSSAYQNVSQTLQLLKEESQALFARVIYPSSVSYSVPLPTQALASKLPLPQRHSLHPKVCEQLKTWGDHITHAYEQQSSPMIRQWLALLEPYGKVAYRLKSSRSTFAKLVRNITLEKHPIHTLKEAQRLIPDGVGMRLVLRDGHPTTVHKLLKHLRQYSQAHHFTLTTVENYHGPSVSPYMTPQMVRNLHAIPHLSITSPTKASGYTTLQLNFQGDTGLTGELQIRGPHVHQVADIEHLLYDLRQGKPLSEPLFPALRHKLYQLQTILRTLTPQQHQQYLTYLTRWYRHARRQEQGRASALTPKLPVSLQTYPMLAFDKVKAYHERLTTAHTVHRLFPALRHTLVQSAMLQAPLSSSASTSR